MAPEQKITVECFLKLEKTLAEQGGINVCEEKFMPYWPRPCGSASDENSISRKAFDSGVGRIIDLKQDHFRTPEKVYVRIYTDNSVEVNHYW